MEIYPIVYFEISGRCNGRCRWCFTGKNNLMGEEKSGKFIPPAQFEKAIRYMLENRIISRDTEIKLYNWGEPLLHPNFGDILEILQANGLKFGISTNASVPIRIPENMQVTGLNEILFSMPGFSQKAYDRIHGFRFETIKQNIVEIVTRCRNHGFAGAAIISYHLYQFNIDELRDAVMFAKENNIFVIPGLAYFANWKEYKDYLTSEMNYADLERASKELFLYYVKKGGSREDSGSTYICPQNRVLSIDEECRVLTCCVISKDNENYSVGDLFSLSIEEIRLLKRTQPVCRECIRTGIVQNIERSSTIPAQLINL